LATTWCKRRYKGKKSVLRCFLKQTAYIAGIFSLPARREALRLYVNGQEMENDCALESYTLAAEAIIRAVTSDEVPSKAPSRAGSVAKSITGSTTAATVPSVHSPTYLQQPQTTPSLAYAPGLHPASPKLPTLFLNDLDGRTVSLNDVPLNLEISHFHAWLEPSPIF